MKKRFYCQHPSGVCSHSLKPDQQVNNVCVKNYSGLNTYEKGCKLILCGLHSRQDKHDCAKNCAWVECACCLENDIDQDMVPCKAGHLFCKQCVNNSVKMALAEGRTNVPCLDHCEEDVEARELHAALPPDISSILLRNRMAEETEKMEGVVICPYCPYHAIQEDPEDQVFICKNEDCGRHSCLSCRRPSHTPSRCEDVTDDDERKRTEEALTEASIRKCANSNCPIIYHQDPESCNMVKCPKCSTNQCALCRKIIQGGLKGYDHFFLTKPNGEEECPLYGQKSEPTSGNSLLAQQEPASSNSVDSFKGSK